MYANEEKQARPDQTLQRSSTPVVFSASKISCTQVSRDSASGWDVEDHRGSISPLDYLARSQDPAVAHRSPSPPRTVATWFHRMRPAKLVGYGLVFGLGLVTVASVACLAFMFIRHDEQVYQLVWTLIVKLSGRIFGGDRGE
ncbi:uncharacterized protein LOC119403174 [Rhipicephalus sanguineus]|uniref:uncharacterized protein LOC119403174 n=1 Tax=Rhipicephalus sanguineus TaxID=34632 RepID=UPI0018961CA0|nr:uncharacterized protein LOC119403174 [Rhipicephalus sanguineus]